MFDYRGYLLERFDQLLGISVLDWPEVGHEDLVRRAVQRTPPFDEKGGGYRDSLIWCDVLELASRGREVVLVSRDRAFAEGDVLKPALQAEAQDLPGSVTLVRDLGAWLIGKLPWAAQDLGGAVVRARQEDFTTWLMQSDFDPAPDEVSLGLPPHPIPVDVEEVTWEGDVVLVDSRSGPDGTVLAEYDLGYTVSFEAELFDWAPVEPSWTVTAGWYPGRVSVSGRIEMIARVAMLYLVDEPWTIDVVEWRRADGAAPGLAAAGIHPDQGALFDLR